MPVPPSPALRETLNAGDVGHIADHEAIAAALNNDTVSLSAAQTVAGNKAFTGDDTFKNLNGIRFADQFAGGSVTAKIDAAIADLGGNPGVVVVPAAMGSGEATSVPENVTILDLGRGTLGDGVRFGASSVPVGGGVDTTLSVWKTWDDPQHSIEQLQSNMTLTGDLTPAELTAAAGAITTTALVTGALVAVNAGYIVLGGEFTAKVNSTGGTLPRIRGATFSASLVGGTTNVTEASAICAQASLDAGGGSIANAYGLIAEAQTVGTVENYGIYNKGDHLIDNNRALDAKTVGGVIRHIERFTTGDGVLYGTLNDANGWTWRDQAAAVHYLDLTSAAMTLGPGIDLFSPADAIIRGVGGLQGKYKSGAGVVTLADGDFGSAVGDGAFGIVNNTTDGKVYLVARAGGGLYKKIELL